MNYIIKIGIKLRVRNMDRTIIMVIQLQFSISLGKLLSLIKLINMLSDIFEIIMGILLELLENMLG